MQLVSTAEGFNRAELRGIESRVVHHAVGCPAISYARRHERVDDGGERLTVGASEYRRGEVGCEKLVVDWLNLLGRRFLEDDLR